MTDDVSRQFAAIKSMLEELHGFAVEGQQDDNSPDMHRVLTALLRTGVAKLNGKLRSVLAMIDGAAR